jgi:thiol-disulfide isomerase/thioredoxin
MAIRSLTYLLSIATRSLLVLCAAPSVLFSQELAKVGEASSSNEKRTSEMPEFCFEQIRVRMEKGNLEELLKLMDDDGVAAFVSNIAIRIVQLANASPSEERNLDELKETCREIQKRFSLPDPEFYFSEKYFPRNATGAMSKSHLRRNADVFRIVESNGGSKPFLDEYLKTYRGLPKEEKSAFQFFAFVGEIDQTEQMESTATIRVAKVIRLLFRKSESGWQWSGIDFDRMYDDYTRVELINDIELNGVTVSGEQVDLATLKGKVVLIDFWGTTCGPCIAELPELKKIYSALNEHGFEIVGVALDDSQSLKEFFQRKPIPWKSIVDGDLVLAKKYNIQAVPTKLLINTTGQHYKSNLSGIKLLDEVIDQLKLDPAKFTNLRDELQKE